MSIRNPTTEDVPLEIMLQRCADGELPETSERALLRQLDQQPHAWRQLALLFIEQRVLRSACSRTLHSAAIQRTPPRPAPVHNWTRRVGPLVSLAAAVLAAFGIGRSWPLPGASSGNPAVTEAAVQARMLSGVEPRSTDSRPGGRPASTAQPAMFVNMLLPGSGRTVQLPVYRGPDAAAAWQPFSEPVLSTEHSDLLRRAGYNVSEQRDLVRMQSPEGFEVIVPVEAIDVQMSRY